MSRLAENIQVNVTPPGAVFLPASHSESSSLQFRVHRSTSQTHCVKSAPVEAAVEVTNGSGPKRSSSGILSFFKWFKKGSEVSGKPENGRRCSTSSSSSSSSTPSAPNSPTFPLSRNQSAASVDSLFSTATVASFTYVPPAVYNPLGDASAPEKLLAPGPDTDTHRNRMKLLEKHRERDKNITLRKKYKLFSSETIKTKSLDIPHPEKSDKIKPDSKSPKSKQKNKNRDYSELSLPLMRCQAKPMDHDKETANVIPAPTKSHRRTVSDSSKDRKAGAYCHVKGKRKAPQPPGTNPRPESISGGTPQSPNSTLNRRLKRLAPPPPPSNGTTTEPSTINNLDTKPSSSPSSHLTREQKDLLITNIAKLQTTRNNIEPVAMDVPKTSNSRSGSSSLNNSIPDIVCNDSLKLEYGVLKPVKEPPKPTNTPINIDPSAPTEGGTRKLAAPVSPISPRPWYKRTLSNRDSIGSNTSSQFKKEYFKHSKSEDLEDALPIRYSGIKDTNSKLSSVLSRFSISSDERKKDTENRKSSISILANISELDREAAMIVQKEQTREQARLEAQNELFYSPSNSQTDVPSFLQNQQQEQQQQQKSTCKKGSARELISRFNALTSATRISVNTALFSTSKDSEGKHSRRFSFQASEREIVNGSKISKERGGSELVVTPPMKRSIFNMGGFTDEVINEEERHVWKPSEVKSSYQPKVINAPPNIYKYFEPQKSISEEKEKEIPTLPAEEDLNFQKYFEPQKPVAVKNSSPPKDNLLHVDKKDFWACTRCTLENTRTDVKCSACGMWKPFGKITNIEKYLAPAAAQKDDGFFKSTVAAKIDTDVNLPANITSSQSSTAGDKATDKKMYVTETMLTETLFSNDNGRNLENDTKMARTFAENVFKAFEMDDKTTTSDMAVTSNDVKGVAIASSVTVIEPEPTMEEMRRARLARFSQHLEEQIDENKNTSPPPVEDTIVKPLEIHEIIPKAKDPLPQPIEIYTPKKQLKTEISFEIPPPNKLLTDEQQKLRKMLKEMKDSLPKNRRNGPEIQRKLSIDKEDIIKEDVELYIDENLPILSKPKEVVPEKNVSKGAIPKVFKSTPKPVIVDELLKMKPEKKEKTIEAYFITQESTYENIKVRKENVEQGKPVKVSAASQTQSSKLPHKPPIGRQPCMIPVTVEELSLKPSISRVSSFGKGTFELIRAKDFAGITSTATTPDSPLYANLPSMLDTDVSQSTTIPSSSPSLQSITTVSSSEEEVLSAQLSDPEGLKDFKATLKQDKHNANTLAINRLLRRLETAIAGGQHIQAARLAKDLARLKVNCSVTRQRIETAPNTKILTVDMYVEDQVSHQGPIPLQVTAEMTVAELKQKVAQEYEIPSHVQRWILDKQLASDDELTLEELNITFDGCPLFLYLVAPDGDLDVTLKKTRHHHLTDNFLPVSGTAADLPETNTDSDLTEEEEEDPPEAEASNTTSPPTATNIPDEPIPADVWKCPVCTLLNALDRPGCEACSTERPRSVEPRQQNYLQLMDLDNTDLVPNTEQFECLVCLADCQAGEGVILRECLHSFCKQCLAHTIQYNEEAEVKCPYRDSSYSCDIVLQEREVKALVTKEVYEQHLALSVSQAENKIDNAFHCKTPDCRGWCIFEDNVNDFRCPVCKAHNCLTCQVIHEGLNCKQYQQQLNDNSENNLDARRTRDLLEEMVSRGEAMVCPTCQVVLMKKWGCDWLRCSMCKTEICWVTRGPRWGPAGKGDTSAGCQCGLNGIKCHPKCTYCH